MTKNKNDINKSYSMEVTLAIGPMAIDLFTDTAAILIRFKEYYRMPRGHEHISFVFSSAFWDLFFLKVFLKQDCNGKKNPSVVFRPFPIALVKS